MNRSFWLHLIAHIFMLTLISVTLLPYIYAVLNSFRLGNYIPGNLIPNEFSLIHWKEALGISYTDSVGNIINPRFPVIKWVFNSIKLAFIATLVGLYLFSLAAYSLYRFNFLFKKKFILGILYTQLFHMTLTLVAFYIVFDKIEDYFPTFGFNSHISLILVYLGGMSFTIWLIYGYLNSIPKAFYEAALIDGASDWSIYWRIILPLITPIMVISFLLSFMSLLTEYPIASTLLIQEDKLTLGVGLQLYLVPSSLRWGDFSAVAILAGIPIVAVFMIGQKWLTSGLTKGGVKG